MRGKNWEKTNAGIAQKKIKHFSYQSTDRIGKGFSSVVYRGTNDNTSIIQF